MFPSRLRRAFWSHLIASWLVWAALIAEVRVHYGNEGWPILLALWPLAPILGPAFIIVLAVAFGAPTQPATSFLAAYALTAAVSFFLFGRRASLQYRRIRTGHCPHCDYDLRAIPPDRCPECGHPFPLRWPPQPHPGPVSRA